MNQIGISYLAERLKLNIRAFTTTRLVLKLVISHGHFSDVFKIKGVCLQDTIEELSKDLAKERRPESRVNLPTNEDQNCKPWSAETPKLQVENFHRTLPVEST